MPTLDPDNLGRQPDCRVETGCSEIAWHIGNKHVVHRKSEKSEDWKKMKLRGKVLVSVDAGQVHGTCFLFGFVAAFGRAIDCAPGLPLVTGAASAAKHAVA